MNLYLKIVLFIFGFFLSFDFHCFSADPPDKNQIKIQPAFPVTTTVNSNNLANLPDLSHTVKFQTFSSEISPESIGVNIFNIVKTAKNSIIIASDKCTNEKFLDDVLTLRNNFPELKIDVVIGDDNTTNSILRSDKYKSINRAYISKKENGGKMHNKFIIVDNSIVITGSPNLTTPAYTINIESFVCIENQHIAELYRSYYEYIIDQTDQKKDSVLKLMDSWNNIPNIPIQVCLAPIKNIRDFIIQKIDAAQIVRINMFLVSQATKPDDDIITHLSELGEAVTVKVDKKQYGTQEYMKTAIGVLTDNKAKVFTVFKSKKSIFHDKLMLIEYKDSSKIVIIGSAGFTTNVQDNINFENMVSINNNENYNFLLNHFNSIAQRKGLEVKELG